MIPKTKEEAIQMLVDSDVARWGESKREALQRIYSRRTYGLALNELANRAELADAPDPLLRKAARAALTPDDRAVLRKGG